MIDLSFRSTQKEFMDDLQCSGSDVDQTLRELEFINRWLGGNEVTLSSLRRISEKLPKKTLRIVDIGCGGGDMLILILKWAQKKEISVELLGLDANPYIVDFAKINTASYPQITIDQCDILSDEFAAQKFDLVFATLFLHHFSNKELIEIFNRLKDQANIAILINDLHRHFLAYYSIKWLTNWFSKSKMVPFDAPLSVSKAFTRNEIKGILKEAGINNYILRWKWAFRWQLMILSDQ